MCGSHKVPRLIELNQRVFFLHSLLISTVWSASNEISAVEMVVMATVKKYLRDYGLVYVASMRDIGLP